MKHLDKLPITVQRAIEIMGLFFMGWIIVLANGILSPILMAFFISIMLIPVYRFFRKYRFPEMLAISASLLVLIIIGGLLIWFFSYQLTLLVQDFPVIQRNVMNHLSALSTWVSEHSPFSTAEQMEFIQTRSSSILNYAGNFLSGAALSVTSIFIFVGLVPIYIFLLLFYRNLLLRFVFLWFPVKMHNRVGDVLHEMQVIIKSYLFGLLIQVSYMTVLLGGLLMIIGIKHALLIGIIFAFLNLIPYVGALIGNIIGVLLTLASSTELWPIFAVLGTIGIVQFIDNNILMPRIVGSKVKINALATIVGVLVGGEIAGIAGMFLSLPIIAILKIIFDRSLNFKQWGVLFGDERPDQSPMKVHALRQKNITTQRELQRLNKVDTNDQKD